MNEFWSTKSMGIEVKSCLCKADKLSPVEREGAKMIENSCRKSGNQWIITYPWKHDPSLLPNNKAQAIKRLEATERELRKNPEDAKVYSQQMKEMEEMNFPKILHPKKKRSTKIQFIILVITLS